MIWYQDGSILDYSNWTKIGDYLYHRSGETICPDYLSGDGDCWELCANSDNNNGYIYRIDSTIGYKNIIFGLDIDPYNMVSEGGCYIQYNTANYDGGWIDIANYSGLDSEVGDEYMLDNITICNF